MPEIGQPAPAFTLTSHRQEQVSLSDFAGTSSVVLAFFPLAFSGVCTKQFTELGKDLTAYTGGGDAVVLAVSVDHAHSLRAFAEAVGAEDVTFLSDFQPRGAVSEAYGVFMPEKGFCGRAVFVIDKDGILRHADISPTPLELPDAAGVAGAVASCAI